MEEDRNTMRVRETQLLNLLVEYKQKEDPYCQHLLHYQESILQEAQKLSKLQQKYADEGEFLSTIDGNNNS